MTKPNDLDANVADIEAAGMLASGTDAKGSETWTHGARGRLVARQLAMGDDVTFNAIVDAAEAGTTNEDR